MKYFVSTRFKKVFFAGIFTLIGSVASQVFALVFISFLARKVHHLEFGGLTYLLTTVQFFAILASGGIGLALTKYIAQSLHVKNSKIIISAIQVFLFFSIISIVILLNINKLLKLPSDAQTMLLSIVGILSISTDAFYKSILIGKKKFFRFSFVTILNAFILTSVNFLVYYIFGKEFIKFGYILGYLIVFLFSIYLIRNEESWVRIKDILTWDSATIKKLLKFSIPLLLSNLIIIYVNWFFQFSLNENKLFEELAMYGIINQYFNMLLFLPVIFNKVTLPFIVNDSISKQHFKKNGMLISSIILFCFLFLLIFLLRGNIITILDLLFGKKYNVDVFYNYIVLCAFLSAISSIIGNILASTSELVFGLFINVVWSLVVLVSFKSLDMRITSILLSLIFGYTIVVIIGVTKLICAEKTILWKIFMSIINLIPPKIIDEKPKNTLVNKIEKDILVILIDYDKFRDRDIKDLGKAKYKCGIKGLDFVSNYCKSKGQDYIRIETTDDFLRVCSDIQLNQSNVILNSGTDISVLMELKQFIGGYKKIVVINSSCSINDANNFEFFIKKTEGIQQTNFVIGFNGNSRISPMLPIKLKKYPHVITNYFATSRSILLDTLENNSGRFISRIFGINFNDKLFCIRYFETYISTLAIKRGGDILLLKENNELSYGRENNKWPIIDSRILRYRDGSI